MIRKKMFVTLLIALMLLGAVFAGCGNSNPGTDSGGGNEGSSRTDLNLTLAGVVSTLDPFATSLTVDLVLFRQIYEGFYYIDDTGAPHPRLALSHEISDDGLIYTFKMREDGVFHNGEKITAKDAVFSFTKAMGSGVLAPYVNMIDKIEQTDDYTVVITLKQPYTPFLANTMQVCIINEKAYTEAGESFGATITGAGSGPYKLASYDGNTRIELAAFQEYYDDAPPIEKVVLTPMADTSTGLIAFENGEVDFIEVPTANWKEIVDGGKYTTDAHPTSQISYMLLNPHSGVLQNQDLRYAIQYAIDRETINLVSYEGMAEEAYHMMHPEYIFGASEDAFHFENDAAKVKEYLTKAGYPDGVDIGTIQVLNSLYYPKLAQAIQSQLAEYGITCTLEMGETSFFVTGWRAGDFNILISGFNAVLDYDYFTRYTSPAVPTSFLKYEGTEYDADWILEMYNKGAAEMDPDKRKATYKELDDYIARSACYVPIFHKTLLYAWDPDLEVKLDLNNYFVSEWRWK